MSSARILIMAGGTGGHVFPALAVAKRLEADGWKILWLGTRKGLEADIVPNANLPIQYISVAGLRGKSIVNLLKAPFQLLIALYQSLRIILAFKPTVVLGMGGYVSGPGGVAAWLLRYPLIIHEQNAYLGTTNRWLARCANRVLEAFPNTFPKHYKAIQTGNPIREELLALPSPKERFKERQGPIRLLVIGGSRGAEALNTLCPKAIECLSPAVRPDIWHQAGGGRAEATQSYYQQTGIKAQVFPFIQDMAAAYAWADIVLCRAGALTISELAAVGVGSILVPYPFAIDDHQMHNGRFLEKAGAAILVRQQDLTPQKLADKIVGFSKDRAQVLNMAEAAKTALATDALTKVITLCKEVANGSKNE